MGGKGCAAIRTCSEDRQKAKSMKVPGPRRAEESGAPGTAGVPPASGNRRTARPRCAAWLRPAVLSIALAALTTLATAAPASEKKNIILILADDLGWADL